VVSRYWIAAASLREVRVCEGEMAEKYFCREMSNVRFGIRGIDARMSAPSED